MSRYMEWVTQVFSGVVVGVIGAGVGHLLAGMFGPEIEEWAFQQLVSSIYGIAIGYSVGAPLGALLAAFFQHRRGNLWLPFLLCVIVLVVSYLLQDSVLSILLVGQPLFAALGYNLGFAPEDQSRNST